MSNNKNYTNPYAQPSDRQFTVLVSMVSILKTTPSSITVQVEDKTIKVSGKSFIRGFGSPEFIIDTSSIKMWYTPYENIFITEEQRKIIVQYLLDELTRRNWVVIAMTAKVKSPKVFNCPKIKNASMN